MVKSLKISTWIREASSRDSPVLVNLLALAETIFTSEGHGNLLSYFFRHLSVLGDTESVGGGDYPRPKHTRGFSC